MTHHLCRSAKNARFFAMREGWKIGRLCKPAGTLKREKMAPYKTPPSHHDVKTSLIGRSAVTE
jgi:hypothetical protein